MELIDTIWEWNQIFISFILALSLFLAIVFLLCKVLWLFCTKLFHRKQPRNTTDVADQYGIIKGFIDVITNIYPIDRCKEIGQNRVKTDLEIKGELMRIKNLSDVFFLYMISDEKRDWIIENIVTNIINVYIHMSAWSCHTPKENATNNEELLELCAKMYEEYNKMSEEIKDLKETDRKDKVNEWLSKEEVTELKNKFDRYIVQIGRNIDESRKKRKNA